MCDRKVCSFKPLATRDELLACAYSTATNVTAQNHGRSDAAPDEQAHGRADAEADAGAGGRTRIPTEL